jgi:selenocysteine lyase/cysteine desulfurase
VDGVAYAPHRCLDMQEFDVDFYAFSFYKTFGPHQAMLFGKYDLLKEMNGINHYFIGKSEVPYKFQPGNFNFELTYSLTGITDYLLRLHDHHFPDETESISRVKYTRSYQLIADHEQELAGHLLDYLNGIPDVKIIGKTNNNKGYRVSTISFIHDKFSSSDIVSKVDPYNIGIRYGDFYAKKLIEDLNLVERDGVVRVSMLHYNTMEEVRKIIDVFQQIFK